MSTEQRREWHLDRKVPVALIIALTLQLMGAVYGFATLAAQVTANTNNIIKSEQALNSRMDRNYQDATRRYGTIERALGRIEDKIDRKADK